MNATDDRIDDEILASIADGLKRDRKNNSGVFDPSKLSSGQSLWTLAVSKKPQVTMSGEICKNYLKGLCTLGTSCHDKHVNPESQIHPGGNGSGKQRSELEEIIRSSIVTKTKVLNALRGGDHAELKKLR